MQLVEQHVISKTDPRYAVVDKAAFASKNLYNAALYEIRQAFIHERRYIAYNQMDKLMKKHEAYKALPAKVAQQVLRLLDKNWASFFAALKAWGEDLSKFLGRPKLPNHKDKTKGRNVLVYTIQAISKPAFKQGIVKPSDLPDPDPLPTYGKEACKPVFSGRRVKRGMYKASDKRKINADVNGSYNIMSKAFPNAFRSNGVEDGKEVLASLVVHPVRIVVPLTKLRRASGQ